MMKTPRAHRAEHLRFIRQLPCVVCLENTTIEAAHIRYGDPTVGKRPTGMGEKPDDAYTVPLCGKHHRQQHSMNEMAFWVSNKIDPIRVSLALLKESSDDKLDKHQRGSQIVAANAPRS